MDSSQTSKTKRTVQNEILESLRVFFFFSLKTAGELLARGVPLRSEMFENSVITPDGFRLSVNIASGKTSQFLLESHRDVQRYLSEPTDLLKKVEQTNFFLYLLTF